MSILANLPHITIHKNACMIFTNGTYCGKPQVKEIFEKNFQLIQNEFYKISALDWIIKKEDYASCKFEFNWSGIIHGEHASGGGRGSMLLTNENGNWQIITEHLSPHPSS